MLTLHTLMCFEGNNDQNSRIIWTCATSPWQFLKRARLKSKWDQILQSTVRECTPCQVKQTSNIGEKFFSFQTNYSCLDVNIKLIDGELRAGLFVKPTDASVFRSNFLPSLPLQKGNTFPLYVHKLMSISDNSFYFSLFLP